MTRSRMPHEVVKRSVMRFTELTIRYAPDLPSTRQAFCTAQDCGQSSTVSDEETVQLWCLNHAGRNPGHREFRRVYTDHARVSGGAE